MGLSSLFTNGLVEVQDFMKTPIILEVIVEYILN